MRIINDEEMKYEDFLKVPPYEIGSGHAHCTVLMESTY
jgi:hypothetical protein